MKKQGIWLNWEEVIPVKLGWNDIWKMEPSRLQFKLKSMYDVLPSPTNLATWGLSELCFMWKASKLRAYTISLLRVLQRWRLDKVVVVFAATLERNVEKPRAAKGGLKFVNFVKEGETGPRAGVEGNGLLGTATYWNDRKDCMGKT